MTRKGGHSKSHHAHHERGDLVRIERGPIEAIAPSAAEWRPTSVHPAIELTVDRLASDLASDPEFQGWRGSEWLAELSARTREVYGGLGSGR